MFKHSSLSAYTGLDSLKQMAALLLQQGDDVDAGLHHVLRFSLFFARARTMLSLL
jgi:hypothetical protein